MALQHAERIIQKVKVTLVPDLFHTIGAPWGQVVSESGNFAWKQLRSTVHALCLIRPSPYLLNALE